MNLAPSSGNANINRTSRPITARTMNADNGRFSKLDFTAADLSSELNLVLGDSIGSTPTPPPTCQVFTTPTPPPNCPPPPPPPQTSNQNFEINTASDEKQLSEEALALQSKSLVMETSETSDTNVSSLSVPNLTDHAESSSPADLCSEPNLSSSNTESSAVSLLEAFAAVARQRASGGSGGVSASSTNANNSRNTANSLNSGIFGRGLTTNSVSSLVRLALSSNFPSGLLNQAQSFPSLNPGQNNCQTRQTNEAEQVSMEEFLESCGATSLLAELDDDEELPEADDDENEDDCDDSEEDNHDEESHLQDFRHGRRKHWDDDYVIKRKFSALIPAFDPRPGRTNVNQTSDLEVPKPTADLPTIPAQSPTTPTPKLSLTVRGPNLPGVPDIEVDLTNPEWTVFKAVQEVAQKANLGSNADKTRRIWEPTYIIVYKEIKDAAPSVKNEIDSLSGSRRSSSLPQL